MDKAKSKMSGGERLANDENEFEKLKAKEVEKERRKEEYEKLGLGDRTKFGKQSLFSWSCAEYCADNPCVLRDARCWKMDVIKGRKSIRKDDARL